MELVPDSSVAGLVRVLTGGSMGATVVHVQLDIGELDKAANRGAAAVDSTNVTQCAQLGASKLDHPTPEVRHAALELLMRDADVLASAAAGVLACFEDPVWFVRRAAVTAVARLLPLARASGPSSVALDALIGRLDDESSEVRIAALRALQDQNDVNAPLLLDSSLRASTLTSAVARATADEAWGVRAAAVRLLGSRGEQGELVHAAIASCCADSAAGVRAAAIDAVGMLGAGAVARHVDAARRLTLDADGPTREAAERLLRGATAA